MSFQKIRPEKISSAVVRQIEALILRGILRPGERLPAERELSDRLGVSRPSLREAVADLSARGLLAIRPGAGVYVAGTLDSVFPDTLIALFASHDEAVFDYLAFRRDIEGLAAERAARAASETDLRLIGTAFDRMEAAHQKRDPSDEAALDADFHMAIVEASHNVVMLHTMRAMFDLLRQGVFYNRQIMFRNRITRTTLLDQHRRIRDALLSRDPGAARQAVVDHLDFVEAALTDQLRADRNETTARLRFAHDVDRQADP